jgi:two-component system sensor histidine kinase NreB
MNLPAHTLEEIINHLPDGIIIMDKNRIIHYMNASAMSLTGWKNDENVPYCSYCQQREIEVGENRCILTAKDPVPFFHSHMAVYSGIEEEFEMSLKRIKIMEEDFYFLRLQSTEDNKNSEKVKFHELLVQQTMLAQEAERSKIARELHDNIGQNVYSVFLGLEGIRQYTNNIKYESHLTNMVKVMERTLNDIKQLSKKLRPEIVYHLGIKDALEEAVLDWKKLYQVDFQLEMDIENDGDFDREKELHLFRVIQEGVSNAVNHGNATSITIHLKSSYQFIYFYIHDNGTGFDVGVKEKKGLGLKHMYERCMMMGGDIRWISSKGGPTKVEGFSSIIKKVVEAEHESTNC